MDRDVLKQRLFDLANEAEAHGAASGVMLTLVSALMMGRERELFDSVQEHFMPQFRASLVSQSALEKRARFHVVPPPEAGPTTI